jgi:predicted porin
MQKKIIVLAIAAALTTPALASAAATIYGQANLSVDMVNDGKTTNGATTNHLTSNESRLGFKGSEDLGGGNSVIWQAESTIEMDTGNAGAGVDWLTYGGSPISGKSQFFDRDTFLGLSNAGIGTLLAGRHDTPYKMSTRRLDLFADNVADNRAVVMGGHDIATSNTIAYVSPSMSGMSVALATVFGAETATGATNNSKKGSAYSLAGMYDQGPIYATLAYQSIKLGDNNTGDLAANYAAGGIFAVDDTLKAVKLGGSYTTDQFGVNLVVEKTTDSFAAGGDQTGTNYYLGGKFNFTSNDAVKLAYGQHGETSTNGVKEKDDAKQTSIGYDHNMSKSTTAYALYTKVSNNAVVNANPSVLSVGMKYAF